MTNLWTEHTIKLPDGIELLYTDSGAPNTADYTTMVVFHGTGFNGYGFARVHEYAHEHNMRTIVCNRRGYRGSTKYTDDELADIQAGRKIFQDRLAVQTAWLLKYLVEEENTPKVTPDGAGGGCILMGWSWGNATVLALLADPAVIPRQVYQTIKPYLRSLVLYDPPFLALGYPRPPLHGVYDPFNDPDCVTGEQVYDNFRHWVTSYYDHPDIESGNPAGMSFEKRTSNRTISRWTEEEKARYCDTLSAVESDLPGSVNWLPLN
ncbi:Alpha/Beta hydrolase protein [Mycena maculata]|uniref:Alpha/Beta hydrolase protein n=1 Tax=Mycena maculata TaxID=230809 RepID=A0AAD7HAB2_9AGAR|nr:Alpha/Beta hydrolase protein [Mycena maculata]